MTRGRLAWIKAQVVAMEDARHWLFRRPREHELLGYCQELLRHVAELEHERQCRRAAPCGPAGG